ncbi:MAG: hypothetical protein Q9167_001824 [Letrouitia subvulpina]
MAVGGEEISFGRYTVKRSPPTPVPLELHPTAFKVSNVLCWTLWSCYVIFQLDLVSHLQAKSSCALTSLWVVVVAEYLLTFQEAATALNIILALFAGLGKPCRPSYKLISDSAPNVDVLITCCGEPIDVITRTVIAAAAQDYPKNKLRVFVLDDGHDDALPDVVGACNARSKRQRLAPIRYLSRTVAPGRRSFFKAGNLRFGIDESDDGNAAEFVAGLDADMIPEADWLRHMIPGLILDHNLALACTPQRYYNVSRSDLLGQQAEFDKIFTIQEILGDRVGAAMCTGTGYVVRRSALAGIGGWPLAETGEDFMCSAVLSDSGWGVAFVRDTLQSGLAPENLKAVITQRMRWIDASLEVCQRFGYYLPWHSRAVMDMPLPVRLVNLLYALADHSSIVTIVALVLLPLSLFHVGSLDGADWKENQSRVITLRVIHLAFFFTHKLNLLVTYGSVGLSQSLNYTSYEVWASPCKS